MKYIAKDQNKNEVIVELDNIPDWCKKNYLPLNDNQLAFLQENPKASVAEIKNCKLASEYILLDEYKELVKKQISALSLLKAKEKIADYQFFNAQASLLLEDGQGIYTHEKANEIIALYNTVGKQFREKYYTFLDELELCEDKAAVAVLINNTTEYYNSL